MRGRAGCWWAIKNWNWSNGSKALGDKGQQWGSICLSFSLSVRWLGLGMGTGWGNPHGLLVQVPLGSGAGQRLGFEGPVLGLQKDQGLDWTGLI